MGHTRAVKIPVTKKRQPHPIGLRFLYMGKPPSVHITQNSRLCYRIFPEAVEYAFFVLTEKNFNVKIKVSVL